MSESLEQRNSLFESLTSAARIVVERFTPGGKGETALARQVADTVLNAGAESLFAVALDPTGDTTVLPVEGIIIDNDERGVPRTTLSRVMGAFRSSVASIWLPIMEIQLDRESSLDRRNQQKVFMYVAGVISNVVTFSWRQFAVNGQPTPDAGIKTVTFSAA